MPDGSVIHVLCKADSINKVLFGRFGVTFDDPYPIAGMTIDGHCVLMWRKPGTPPFPGSVPGHVLLKETSNW